MSKHEATIARIKAAFPGFSEEPLDPSNPRFASPGPVVLPPYCPGCHMVMSEREEQQGACFQCKARDVVLYARLHEDALRRGGVES